MVFLVDIAFRSIRTKTLIYTASFLGEKEQHTTVTMGANVRSNRRVDRDTVV